MTWSGLNQVSSAGVLRGRIFKLLDRSGLASFDLADSGWVPHAGIAPLTMLHECIVGSLPAPRLDWGPGTTSTWAFWLTPSLGRDTSFLPSVILPHFCTQLG